MKKMIALAAILLLMVALAACGNSNHAREFILEDMAGNNVDLTSFHGRPMVLNFWATWCPACTDMMPDLEAAYQTHGDDVQFLAINLIGSREAETRERVLEYIESNGFTFPVYFDNEDVVSRTFAVQGIPLTVFVNAQGEVVFQQTGSLPEIVLDMNIRRILP